MMGLGGGSPPRVRKFDIFPLENVCFYAPFLYLLLCQSVAIVDFENWRGSGTGFPFQDVKIWHYSISTPQVTDSFYKFLFCKCDDC